MPNTIYRVTLDSTMYGQQLQNVLHFSHPSSDPATLQTLADEIAASWIGEIRFEHSASVKYTRIRVLMLESQFAAHEKTVNINGSWGGDDGIHTFTCFIIRLRTATIGRRGRGRQYISGVLKGWTVNGFVHPDNINSWNNRFQNIMAVFGPGGSSLARLGVCNHRAPFVFHEVTSLQIAPTLGVQRRRNIGVGL